MINLGLQSMSLEEAIDVIAEILIGPEFGAKLTAVHEKARRKIPFRFPEFVYTEDIAKPDGYPCCELIAILTRDQVTSTAVALENEISCQWTVNGDDEQTMGREVKRLVEATRDTLRSATLLPQAGGTIWTGDVDFGPVISSRAAGDNPSGRYIKSASVALFWKAYGR
jgi:hypothetical protein